MVDMMNICKSLNISIGTAMKNPEMLKFIPDHLKPDHHVTNLQLNNLHNKTLQNQISVMVSLMTL